MEFINGDSGGGGGSSGPDLFSSADAVGASALIATAVADLVSNEELTTALDELFAAAPTGVIDILTPLLPESGALLVGNGVSFSPNLLQTEAVTLTSTSASGLDIYNRPPSNVIDGTSQAFALEPPPAATALVAVFAVPQTVGVISLDGIVADFRLEVSHDDGESWVTAVNSVRGTPGDRGTAGIGDATPDRGNVASTNHTFSLPTPATSTHWRLYSLYPGRVDVVEWRLFSTSTLSLTGLPYAGDNKFLGGVAGLPAWVSNPVPNPTGHLNSSLQTADGVTVAWAPAVTADALGAAVAAAVSADAADDAAAILAAVTGLPTADALSTGLTAAEDRANHTGTQVAATISDFAAAVAAVDIDTPSTAFLSLFERAVAPVEASVGDIWVAQTDAPPTLTHMRAFEQLTEPVAVDGDVWIGAAPVPVVHIWETYAEPADAVAGDTWLASSTPPPTITDVARSFEMGVWITGTGFTGAVISNLRPSDPTFTVEASIQSDTSISVWGQPTTAGDHRIWDGPLDSITITTPSGSVSWPPPTPPVITSAAEDLREYQRFQGVQWWNSAGYGPVLRVYGSGFTGATDVLMPLAGGIAWWVYSDTIIEIAMPADPTVAPSARWPVTVITPLGSASYAHP